MVMGMASIMEKAMASINKETGESRFFCAL